MSDALAAGRGFRMLSVVDNFNIWALPIEIDTSIKLLRLMRIFEQLWTQHELPHVLRADNGPQFLGETVTCCAKEAGMAIQTIRPGKSNHNVCVERFNRTYREVLLAQCLFASLYDAREATYRGSPNTTSSDRLTRLAARQSPKSDNTPP